MGHRARIDNYRGPTTLGIDVSYHRGSIDWRTVAEKHPEIRFAVVRTGDGARVSRASEPDPLAVANLRGARDARIPVLGTYHYHRGAYSADVQAKVILDVLAEAAVKPAFVAIDIEGKPQNGNSVPRNRLGAWWTEDATGIPTRQVLDEATVLRKLLTEAGLRVLVYTGVAWHWYVAQRGLAESSWKSCPLWTPDYTKKSNRLGQPRLPVDRSGKGAPWKRWTIWQYSSEGRVAGIRGGVDMNLFRGDEDTLIRWARA